MNKWLLRFGAVLLFIGIMTGCGASDTDDNATEKTDTGAQTEEQSEDQDNGEQDEATVAITISTDEGDEVIDEKEVPVEADAILMDVLKENFEVEENGGFITSIEGIVADEDEEKAWMYSVNGEEANVGAADYELDPGDEVSFDLHAW